MASSKALILLFAFALLSQVYAYEGHTCNHDDIEQNPEFLDIEEDTSAFGGDERILAASPNIKIYPYYEYLKSSAPASYAAYIQTLIPPIVDFFQAALKVKSPVVGALKLGSSVSKICERPTPSILKTTGVAADFFIYFDSEAESTTQIAASKYCYLASGTKRPLIARTMINRNMMKEANGDVLNHEMNMYVLMHELMHTFGISGYQYANFIDNNGATRKGHIKSVSIAGKTRTVLDLPPLTERLRKFYGCSTLQGAVMENGGGSGTDSSHFERKFFVYEAMSSGSIAGRKISEFSLALLEGSGWYIPDYTFAEPYSFGQGQGCGFVTGTCSSSSSQFEEFCTENVMGCVAHGRGGGRCKSDSLSDGCKYYSPDKDYDCENPDAADWATLPELQTFGRGLGSKCFTGTLTTPKKNPGATKIYCFKYNCVGTGSSTQLEVLIGSNKAVCTKEGTTKTVSGYNGSITCPDPLTFCSTVGKKYCPRNCMGRGTCVNGSCQCKSGYKGVDCALKA